jgi:FixJ family two-component response regulator
MNSQGVIYVIDDDPEVRRSLGWMLEGTGAQFAAYESAEAFLNDVRIDGPSCVILDMRLGGMSGLELLNAMRTHADLLMPVIVLTGSGDIATAVQCMKLGVREFFEKPVRGDLLLAAVGECLESDGVRRALATQQARYNSLLSQLTRRERDVLDHICRGESSKQIGIELKISIKTVENHRWHLMKKLQVSNAAEAVHFAHLANAA